MKRKTIRGTSMKDMKYKDFIVHYTSDDNIRLAVAVTKDITETARTNHTLSPVACAALGRTMPGA
uniref:Hsp33 family molecular chaperone HslO n=1 Tax=Megasphaera micronuciformis TaxID=187326 RepID=UPI0040291496